MKITEVKVNVLKWDIPPSPFHVNALQPPKWNGLLVRVITSNGIEGNSFGWGFGGGGRALAEVITSVLKPVVVGEDPLSREKIWQRMWSMDRRALIPPTSQGPIDVSLWDIAGKVVGLPVYKLLGAYREKVKAYASSPRFRSVEDYVNHAKECKRRGYTAYKLHVWGEPERDLDACRSVREAVGDDMVLMLDAADPGYDHIEALKVGRELEKLKFYWYEEPLRDYDIHGYIDLSRSLDIPIAGAEWMAGSLYSSTEYIVRHALDIIRSDVQIKGGITPLKKTASLCEAFGMNCEIHTTANPIMDAANLHVTCAIKNCNFFEILEPQWVTGTSLGVIEDPTRMIDKDGYVHALEKPGIGIEIDWDQIEEHTIEIL